ncbi:MAG: DNA cytosine methyltransferase, partial [Novosphingobium sp.]|nr:DNA cytosine methyltransferase [Novosphingobium sp.]
MIRFGSVCSGIEAASIAFAPLGWRAAWLSEIEAFPSAVLAHHYQDVPNLGDMTTIAARVLAGEVPAPDVLCGGTPCQAFSVAGLRKSLDDERGNLSLTFCEIADAIDHVRGMRGQPPSIIFWENVPGVLSTRDNAFGCFLGELAGESGPLEPAGRRWTDAGCVYGPARAVAWRVLDAQYFGLAQRRRRVFVVASARKGFDPATVLFEWDGVRRDSAPGREARQSAAGCF